MATIENGIIGYVEIAITVVKPTLYTNSDRNTLVHPLVHTYLPGTSEPINAHYEALKQLNGSFEVKHIDLFKDPVFNTTVCDVQLSPKIGPRVFPLLPKSWVTESFHTFSMKNVTAEYFAEWSEKSYFLSTFLDTEVENL